VQIFTASSQGSMSYGSRTMRCALGKGGVKRVEDKREGDGASPIGIWSIRRVMWRADRLVAPITVFDLTAITFDDGWCDASDNVNYNQPVTHPYPASAERLWREDELYDIIVVLGYNDDPVGAGKGSAIFMHCAQDDYEPTQGCVALARPDLLALLAVAQMGDSVEITQ
jgi:L,D-peptidoglycan transpeptidase YkuD (ErfK/YbiS/YcfS/YnhG family)